MASAPIGKGILGKEASAVRQRVEAMEKLMEGMLHIPGTNQKVGLDVILSILPFGGTTLAAVMGAYMVWEARNLNMSKSAVMRMLGNVGFDWLLGLVPFVGVIPDFFFRSNSRNLRIIRRHLDKHHPATATINQ
ncbi:DUF4112 domain-containing protein [Sphingomonas sp. AOB5]|uniref:DUF4112 domain-containing protein n=1 Tax=Sphingomonas sp. AOB5 TaxID=3034017 RepID=UPI0023F621B5|nr:DUF4112 domain-containing protein [Sphingomonas sp. AOB5]MDF7775200.1 DUF4112 domain-containing protein [Sphingomonas sp. AOB5]